MRKDNPPRIPVRAAIFLALLLIPFSLMASYATADTASAVKMADTTTKKALFAGGCFWCMEKPFEKLPGVLAVTSGYTGGTSKHPTYQNYNAGGHIEVVEITYNPALVDFKTLLDVFWHQIDPTDAGGQFVDRGHAYTSAVFYFNEHQRTLAEASKKALSESQRFTKDLVTPILPASPFYAAEEYHQDYYKKNPTRYWYYRRGSGRDQFLDRVWGEDRKHNAPGHSLKDRLTPLQYEVTQLEGTEPPFKNAYWDNKRAGIYVDIVSGEPLFSSLDKFKSGTGWPSFTRPLVAANIVEKKDSNLFYSRTELRSGKANSHLGHVFNDGPQPTGLRYCINSASMNFIPLSSLKEKGYGQFLPLFKK
ncbi:MAG: peptide-methionine (R)-S-oxide reductase MsrB [Mariprofundaceae bacterium]|nr:peptide-methionine (R)-S-oxide reductase MsrB [Mariprofundaceae bacterium]